MEMMSSSSSSTTQVVSLREMGMYEPFQQLSGWENAFNTIGTSNQNNNNNPSSSTVPEVEADDNNKANYTSMYNNSVEAEPSSNNDQDDDQINDKMKRRLAQNREAARKSRLRKKAHVQQLEESRLKLSQLEQELARARQQVSSSFLVIRFCVSYQRLSGFVFFLLQGLCVRNSSDSSYLGPAGTMNTGIAAFEMEYTHWLEEQNKRVSEIRTALQAHISDIELKMLVDICLNHYANLFRMKADAAKADVFFLISGMWRTSTERFFQWIGGFRPSELLNVVMPYIEPLTDQQLLEVRNLQQSSQQAEEALSQGLDKLQQGLVENIAVDIRVVESANHGAQMASAMENLQALEGFVNQADHLRKQTLQQMSKILTTRQAARGLLALGEYFHRLRALSSLWAARPRERT
ncbi:transcription factor TGA3 isoform X1 [Brassica rapa]|uniref:transcription factor TGA3 isoform X1 n=1 Tax=Brassica campestris TaxID=3711 RepID=UPI00142D5484|nr:transcription factor TGA3 isoform X1 [Brassica rapa]